MKFYRDINTLEPLDKAKATSHGHWVFNEMLWDFDYTDPEKPDYTDDRSLTAMRDWLRNKSAEYGIYGVRMKDNWGNKINAMCIEICERDIAALFKLTWC